MNMKDHILAALREEYDGWEALLASLSEAQISSTPLTPSDWTIKDVIAHLRAWQQRSIARVEAAQLNREPLFPWSPEDIDPEGEVATDKINAWIYNTYREQPWSKVHQDWSMGFQHFLDAAGQIFERDLLDSSKYPWLKGYPLEFILVASYDHHQEHFEKLQTWLSEHQ